MKKTFYLKKEWLKEKIECFPFQEHLPHGLTYLDMREQTYLEDSPWHGRIFEIHFYENASGDRRKIELCLFPSMVEVGYISSQDIALCERLAHPIYDYLINQRDCPLKFAIFGNVEAEAASLPF